MNIGNGNKVLCPLYRKDTADSVCCEGLTDDSVILVRYSQKSSCKAHIDEFCKDNFTKCKIYKAVIKAKYENEVSEF